MSLPNPFLNARGKLRSGWWVAIFFAILAALLVPLIVMHGESGVPIWHQGVVVLLASVSCQALRRAPMAELFGAFDLRWPRDLGVGMALGALLMIAPALLLMTLGCARFSMSTGAWHALAPGLLLFAAVALVEELTFRGFVFQRLMHGLGPWPAQILIGGLFVLTHSAALTEARALGILAGANIFLASIMFGLAFLRTRSLAMPIGLHFAADFVQGAVLGFGVSGNDGQGLLRPTLTGPDWLTGAAFGIEASVPGLVCVVATIALLLRWPQRAMS